MFILSYQHESLSDAHSARELPLRTEILQNPGERQLNHTSYRSCCDCVLEGSLATFLHFRGLLRHQETYLFVSLLGGSVHVRLSEWNLMLVNNQCNTDQEAQTSCGSVGKCYNATKAQAFFIYEKCVLLLKPDPHYIYAYTVTY